MRIFIAGFLLLLSGCATSARQTEAFLLAPRNIPESHKIADVHFIGQTDHYCGPATLAMAMNWAGKKLSADELASQVYTPGKKGTLQQDLISASRRQGMLAIPIQGMSALLHEIAADHPVIILENLAFSWYPQWHYALVFGYDLSRSEVIMHSGSRAAKHWGMRKFERSWIYSDFWGLVVLPPTQLSATADDLAHNEAAAGLEQVGKLEEASTVYQNILKRWPGSLPALIGLGNIAFLKQNYLGAIQFLLEATKLHPKSSAAWHNLATAQGAADKKDAAHLSTIRALELVPKDSAAIYHESLKDWIVEMN